MKQCSIADLKPGMVLGMSIHGYFGSKRTLLLGMKAKLTAPIIGKLESIGYSFVYIEEEGIEDVIPEDLLSEETRDNSLLAISGYYEKIHSTVKDLIRKDDKAIDILKQQGATINLPKIAPLKESLNNIIQDLFLIGSVDGGYHTISGISRFNAIHKHVLSVAVISLLIGNEFGYVDSEQTILGMGALLHDVGKAVLPGIYEKRYWELDQSEHAIMREHSRLGEKLLSGVMSISEAERQIIIQHHERQDGKGYPFGLQGDNSVPVKSHYIKPNHVFRFAEIVAVADMFDNLVSGNYYPHRLSTEEALNELFKEAGTGLNTEIIRTLSSLVILYPVASIVKIEKHPDPDLEGYEGVVAKADGPESDIVEVIILYDADGKRISPRPEKIYLDEHELYKLAVAR